jgi:hypothetical protein
MKIKPSLIILCFILIHSLPAYAGQAEVRDVAIGNNCPPKKIEVYHQELGANGDTVYRVQCTLPKTVGDTDKEAKPPDAILVTCEQNLCEMLRPVALDKK